MSDHALLSPSSAERWINCPPSAVINAQAGSQDTAYTREGTLAHALAEHKAHRAFLGDMRDEVYTKAVEVMRKQPEWDDEMEGYTDTYIEALEDIYDSFPVKPHVAIEQRLDFTQYVPDGFGTADCIMVAGDELHIVDFKYGKGVAVSAQENAQMMLYALGALIAYAGIYDVETVHMTIVQPRIKSEPDTYTMSAGPLYMWARQVVKPAADLAAKGEGEYAEGDWCRWCAIRGTCRARAAANTALEDFGFRQPPELTDAEVAQALTLGRRLATWLKDVEGYALDACLEGHEIPGYKAVEGRSVRAWTDEAAAFQAARDAGIPEEMLYERKPVTLAGLEKIMGKKPFAAALGTFVTTPPGKPTLALESDKKPAITGKPTAKDDFGGPEE